MFWTNSLTGLDSMKKTTFLRKLNFLIALGGIFAAVAFYGCGNLFSSIDSASDSPTNLAQPRDGYGIVSGSLPSSDSPSARTAMPSKPDETALSFKVFAQSGSQRIEANVNDADRTFSLSLPFGTWEITANGMVADGRIIFTQTQTVTLSEENATAFLRFELGYSTNPDDGDGEISLSVSFPPKNDTSAIRGIEYVLSKGEEKIIQNVGDAELGAGKFKIGLATENLGAWHLTILFYGDFSNLVYRIDQTVNVYANLTTDTFEGSAPYISGGKIVLTKALLEDFQNTTLYVNATSGKDTNTGTQFDPLQTFNRALELVNNSTRDASTEFRIFLQTDVADGAMLELKIGKKLTVASVGADGTARKITSLGRTFIVPATSELTVQSVACKNLRFEVSGTFAMDGGEISGNTADNGGAICINAGGKATVANTKIHDNTASNKGGGVYVGGSANATLTNCAIKSCKTTSTTSTNGGGGIYSLGTLIVTGGTISDCIAGRSGGGIYAYGGTVECSDGVAFSNCEATGSGNVGSGGGICINSGVTVNVSGCTFVLCKAGASGGGIWNAGELDVSNTSFTTCSANNNGGGVCNDGGTVTMSGTAKITGNNASDGGGVAVNSGTFTLENGTISNNTANNGGGVYVTGDTSTFGSFTMKNGTIFENTANSGGGVCVYNGIFIMEGGEISDNTAKGVDGERFGGGGIFLYRATTSTPGGTFTLKGGTVSRNKAEYGGGIWTSNFSEFTMTGGTFSGNTSTENGNGAYVNPGCTFKMSGAAQFAKADDVYLNDSNQSLFATITVADTLNAESPVATITPSAYDLDRPVLSAGVTIDSAVCAQFALTPNPDEPDAEWNIMPDSTGANGVLKTKMDIYVRGNNATWYESNEPTATASDDNAGTLRAPLATIQKAIEKVLEQNDGADAYTIFVDGTLDGTTASNIGTDGMADFSELDKNLTLTIKALSETAKATLDGGARFDASGNATTAGIGKRIIYAKPAGGTLALTLENLVIKGGNVAKGDGGGIYIEGGNATLTMNGGEISGNTAGAKGGGIYNNGGTVKMKGCTITDCKAGGTSNDEGGGGIYNASGTLELTGVTITLDSDGTRAAYQGGGIFNAGTLAMTGGSITGGGRLSGNLYRHGGGIYNTGVLTIEGVTISNFYTGGYGGGIYNNNGETAADFVTIKDCIITDCGSGQVGSGICTYKGKLKLENVDIIGGMANTSTGIYCYVSKLTIIGGKIEGFKKAAILTSSSSELKMDGTTVSGNTSTYSCGGVEVDCPFEIKNCTITGNEAKDWSNNQNGGGLYIGNCTGTITNTTISGNTAGGDGGGVYIFGTADVTITDCIIKDNTATTGGGGGIYIDGSTATLKMEGGEISGNTAGGDGGGVAVNRGTFTLENGTISGNRAAYGAGVHVNGGGKFTMTGGTISDNTADGKNDSGGGGIHLFNGTVEMSGGEIIENHAKGTAEGAGGGGMYIYHRDTNKFTMTGGSFSKNTATNRQGRGAFVSPGCAMNMSGEAQFAKDDDVYLYAYDNSTIPTITVAGSLSASSVATITPSAYTVGRQVLSAGGIIPAITQDICGKFAVTYQYGTNWIIMPNDTGANGVLMKTNTVYLNASSGSDTNSGLTASKAVKTLSKAIELYDTYRSDEIMLCAEYTLANGENTLLNRAGKRILTLMRYDGSSDVSDVFTGSLLKITQGSVTITNVMVNGKSLSQNVSEECGRILWIEGETTTVTLGDNARLSYNKSKENGNVYIAAGTFKMEDGSYIYSNTAEYGGGVQVNGGTFEMSGGEITNNKAKYGAGVSVEDGTFTMSGTAEISSNIADYGGGLYIWSGTFTMSSGKITNNTAKSGGGVYNRVTFTISGGEITGNKANISPNKHGVTGSFTNTGGTVQED